MWTGPSATDSHVRRLIINTPDECVIGGVAVSVAAVINRLACEAIYLDGIVAVHCDAAAPVARAYRDLHLFDTTALQGVRFYSVARGQAYDLTSEAAADSILDQAINGFNFPAASNRPIETAFEFFVEIGPHNSCTRMISRILGDRPHLAIAANHRHEDENFYSAQMPGHIGGGRCKLSIYNRFMAILMPQKSSVSALETQFNHSCASRQRQPFPAPAATIRPRF